MTSSSDSQRKLNTIVTIILIWGIFSIAEVYITVGLPLS